MCPQFWSKSTCSGALQPFLHLLTVFPLVRIAVITLKEPRGQSLLMAESKSEGTNVCGFMLLNYSHGTGSILVSTN